MHFIILLSYVMLELAIVPLYCLYSAFIVYIASIYQQAVGVILSFNVSSASNS